MATLCACLSAPVLSLSSAGLSSLAHILFKKIIIVESIIDVIPLAPSTLFPPSLRPSPPYCLCPQAMHSYIYKSLSDQLTSKLTGSYDAQ